MRWAFLLLSFHLGTSASFARNVDDALKTLFHPDTQETAAIEAGKFLARQTFGGDAVTSYFEQIVAYLEPGDRPGMDGLLAFLAKMRFPTGKIDRAAEKLFTQHFPTEVRQNALAMLCRRSAEWSGCHPHLYTAFTDARPEILKEAFRIATARKVDIDAPYATRLIEIGKGFDTENRHALISVLGGKLGKKQGWLNLLLDLGEFPEDSEAVVAQLTPVILPSESFREDLANSVRAKVKAPLRTRLLKVIAGLALSQAKRLPHIPRTGGCAQAVDL